MALFEAPRTEPQCLSDRLSSDIVGVLNDLRWVHDQLQVGTLDEPVRQTLTNTSAKLLDKLRGMQFDIQRLGMLVDDQTKTLRDLFRKTIFMVDDLRASAAIDGGWSDTLNNAMAHVGDMQQAICGEFPGEEFPAEV